MRLMGLKITEAAVPDAFGVEAHAVGNRVRGLAADGILIAARVWV